jgi:hypothetical protein
MLFGWLFRQDPARVKLEALFSRWAEGEATEIKLLYREGGFWLCQWQEGGQTYEAPRRIPVGQDAWLFPFTLRVERLNKARRKAAKLK